jgi:translation elongation factor P/translation initiation factor 5A
MKDARGHLIMFWGGEQLKRFILWCFIPDIMVSAGELGIGDYFKVKNDIFGVVRKELINVGTHCHTKIKLIVESLNGGGEKQMVYSHEDKLESVDVRKSKGQVVLKGNGTVQVMDLFSYETVDANIEPELLAELNEGDTVAYVDVEGRKKVTDKLRTA